MLIVGNYETYIQLPDNYKYKLAVYNFSSLKENFGKRLELLPVTQMNAYDKTFDQFYMDFIMTNDIAFMSFMQIIYQLYCGLDVYIGISNGDIYESLAESLTKIIQCRYGYNAQFIHTIEDFDFNDDSEFSSIGIETFDSDRERYISLLKAYGYNTEGMI